MAVEGGVNVEVLYLGVAEALHGPSDCRVEAINLRSVRPVRMQKSDTYNGIKILSHPFHYFLLLEGPLDFE